MSEEPRGSADAPAEPVAAGRRGVSVVWLIPIVALAVAAGLAYRAIEERGPRVVIVFESAEGLVAGKSVVKYRDVEVGRVDDVRIRDLKHVEVHCSLGPDTARYLTEGSQWWVVRPRVSSAGVSGLDTILSGAYVTFQPGPESATTKRSFVGLEDPPLPTGEAPGLDIVLHAQDLGHIDAGTPIFYRDIKVGEVRRFELDQEGRSVEVTAVVFQEHIGLVRKGSRFWNAGGVDVSLGAQGLDVKTEGLKSLIAGGIAFDSPQGSEAAKDGDAFWLHASQADARESALRDGGLRLVLEADSTGGVRSGSSVYYRELPVGAVVSDELSKDGRRVRITVNIAPRYEWLVRSNTVFWNASGISANLSLHGLEVHTESLQALLAGGVSFATPPAPGDRVKEGSVFVLHQKAKDEWRQWQTDFDASKADAAGKKQEGVVARFFHHEGKSEAESKQDDPTPEKGDAEQKHGFFRRLFHGG